MEGLDTMKWTRELQTAERSLRTVLRAVSSSVANPLKTPLSPAKEPHLLDLTSFVRRRSALGGAGQPEEIETFGSNPARLRMLVYQPRRGAPANAPLVVALHGCGQQANDFAQSAGWAALADELGFTLVAPEQSGRNHQGRCFQWFQPAETTRGQGEVLSILQMVETAIEHFHTDPKRVFVVGLSAGGAMTAALLAAYPDVFAGGAVVAGLPVGAASGTAQALIRMAHPGPERAAAAWAEQVRAAAPAGYRGGWPRISIWHGTADTIVDPGNADLLSTQWGAVYGLNTAPSTDISEPAARHRRWNQDGETILEQWTVPGMAHGYPIDATTGTAGPYFIDAHISATRHIARFWGLLRGDAGS